MLLQLSGSVVGLAVLLYDELTVLDSLNGNGNANVNIADARCFACEDYLHGLGCVGRSVKNQEGLLCRYRAAGAWHELHVLTVVYCCEDIELTVVSSISIP